MGWYTRVALGLTALLLVAYTFVLAPRGHYSADAGVKLIQAYDLWQNGLASRALRHDRVLDPEGRWYRTGIGFERRVDGPEGERQGIYSIVFVAPAAVLAGLFGFAGTLALPLAGTLLLAAMLARLLARLGCRDAIVAVAVAFTALATPVLFYTAQLFEHTLAAGLITAALATLAGEPRGRGVAPAIFAGALAGLAATIRPDAYCALVSLVLWPLVEPGPVRRRLARAAALGLAAVAVVAAYWWLNLATAGTWDPLVAVNHKPLQLKSVLLMLWGDAKPVVRWMASVPAIVVALAALAPPRVRRRRAGVVGLSLLGAATVAIVCCAIAAQEYSRARILTGMLAVTPVALLGVVHGPWDPRTRGLWLFAITLAAQVLVLDRTGSGGGLQFGARLLLPVLPALIALAAIFVDRELARAHGRAARAVTLLAAAALMAVSLAGQIRGMRQGLALAAAGAAAAEHAAEAPGRIVVARLEWQAGVLSPVLFRGKDIVISRDKDNGDLFRRIVDRGDTAFVYVDPNPPNLTLATRNGPRQTISEPWALPAMELLTMQTVRVSSPPSARRH